jgi:nicotinamide-nucleotide amidase
MTDADLVGPALQRRGQTLAVAESLTGGLLASTFARAVSASDWFQGGVIAYSSSVKYHLLEVPPGPVVSETAAVAMAGGAARLLRGAVAIAPQVSGGQTRRTGSRREPCGSPPGPPN